MLNSFFHIIIDRNIKHPRRMAFSMGRIAQLLHPAKKVDFLLIHMLKYRYVHRTAQLENKKKA